MKQLNRIKIVLVEKNKIQETASEAESQFRLPTKYITVETDGNLLLPVPLRTAL